MIVPPNTKINSEYYVQHVLRPLIEKELPKLYPNEMHKLLIDHDKAPSHTSNYTFNFLNEMKKKHGISFQNKDNIVVKGPDCSPLDFFGFGWLKYKVKERRVTTFKGFCKIIRDIWSELRVETCLNVYESWKKHVFRFIR